MKAAPPRWVVIAILGACLALAACATGHEEESCGGVPRDLRGEPVLDQVHSNPC